MALINCKECKAQISTDAKTCPQCGAKRPSRLNLKTLGIASLGGIIVFTALQGDNKPAPSAAATAATSSTIPKTNAPSADEPGSTWSYSDQTDQLSGKSAHYGTISSSNTLAFDWPYASPDNRGHLTVRRHPTHGVDVYLSIDKGQMICHYNDCRVAVRFDDGAPRTYEGAEPEDHSSTTVFILDTTRFVAAAKKAKTIRVQFTAYQAGSPTLVFGPTEALKWP